MSAVRSRSRRARRRSRARQRRLLSPVVPVGLASRRIVRARGARLHHAQRGVRRSRSRRGHLHRVRSHAVVGGGRRARLLGQRRPVRAGERPAVHQRRLRAAARSRRRRSVRAGARLRARADRRGAAAVHARDPYRPRRERARAQPARAPDDLGAPERRHRARSGPVVSAGELREPGARRRAEEPDVSRPRVDGARARAMGDLTNEMLEPRGRDERVDHRSYERQGIDREPGEHYGPAGAHMAGRGVDHERLDEAAVASTSRTRCARSIATSRSSSVSAAFAPAAERNDRRARDITTPAAPDRDEDWSPGR